MSEPPLRDPHAILDEGSRALKASKIVAQLGAVRSLEGATVLDIGCGSGLIARELGRSVGPNGSAFGIDVVDQRTTSDGYVFECVSGTTLPFDDASFDIVVSNHCIEHVGGRRDQLHHLVEVQRVLRPEGVCYLAVPNRWTLVEPHFRLPFLSWLPTRIATAFVRISRRGASYDCNIPSSSSLARLARQAGLEPEEITVGALSLIAEIERPIGLRKMLLRTPPSVAAWCKVLMPTRMYILRHATRPPEVPDGGSIAHLGDRA